jgi:hypothetical protein
LYARYRPRLFSSGRGSDANGTQRRCINEVPCRLRIFSYAGGIANLKLRTVELG